MAVEVSKRTRTTSKPGFHLVPGGAWRVPAYWPGGVRHGGHVSLVCCFHVEREKARPETSAPQGGERERPKRLKP